MTPLIKALSTIFVLAAGALGTSLEGGLPFLPPAPNQSTGNNDGNQTTGDGTGNETGNGTVGNQTSGDGNATDPQGNETGPDGNETDPQGNETGPDGNETSDDNATAEEETEHDATEPSAICSFNINERGRSTMPDSHDWEWLVSSEVTSLSVEFDANGGVPTGLGSGSEVRLVDGRGRVLARGEDGSLTFQVERGIDYLAGGTWRLSYESDDAFADYSLRVQLGCDGGA